MFEYALWRSVTHAKQPLWFIMAPMIVLFVAIPFIIHFLGIGIVFAIDVILALVLVIVVIIIGRKFKWHNPKLLFAVLPDGVYFTTTNAANGSYFYEGFNNIEGYSYVKDGNFVTVKIYFKQQAYAGVFGNIKSINMIKIDNFDKLQEVLTANQIPVIEEKK